MGRQVAYLADLVGVEAAILSVTEVNAAVCDVDRDRGTIEVGKVADLIVVPEEVIDRPELLADQRRPLQVYGPDGPVTLYARSELQWTLMPLGGGSVSVQVDAQWSENGTPQADPDLHDALTLTCRLAAIWRGPGQHTSVGEQVHHLWWAHQRRSGSQIR